jgi:hypothetical protein
VVNFIEKKGNDYPYDTKEDQNRKKYIFPAIEEPPVVE